MSTVAETIPLDSIIADVPPLYKVLFLTKSDGGDLTPKTPLALFPDGDMHSVFLKFFGLNTYDSTIAFPSLRTSGSGTLGVELKSIDYQIVVIGKSGPSITSTYHHNFKGNVILGNHSIRVFRGPLIKMYNALEHMPKLPNDWQYMQFIG
jgi:hypothetical protein